MGCSMIKRKHSRFYKLRLILIIILIITIILGICFFKMQPLIFRNAVSVAETIMLNSANDAVVNILKDNDVTYTDIVNLTTNNDGYVTSLEIDIYEINYLKSHISNEISKIIEQQEFYSVQIPVGTFLGNTYTSGLGPKLKFNMQMTTTAFVDFRHEFKSAGINQVLHLVMIDIIIKGSLIINGYNKGIETSTSTIAAQTVIVGNTPEAFTNVIESEQDNTGGLINDYGAIVEY